MRNLYTLLLLILLTSCRSTSTIVTNKEVISDTTIVEMKDTTIAIELPQERVADIVRVTDTLWLETSVAEAKAWVDKETGTLKGQLNNKPDTVFKKVYIPMIRTVTVRDRSNAVEKTTYRCRIPFWFWTTFFVAFVYFILKIIKIAKL